MDEKSIGTSTYVEPHFEYIPDNPESILSPDNQGAPFDSPRFTDHES